MHTGNAPEARRDRWGPRFGRKILLRRSLHGCMAACRRDQKPAASLQAPIDYIEIQVLRRRTRPGSYVTAAPAQHAHRSAAITAPGASTGTWTSDTPPSSRPGSSAADGCPRRKPCTLLLDLPRLERAQPQHGILAEDARYWRIAASVVLEALAAQKVGAGDHAGKSSSLARWQTVLDSPRDAQRLAFLEKNMPPICRSELQENQPADAPSPAAAVGAAQLFEWPGDALAANGVGVRSAGLPKWKTAPGAGSAALFQPDPRIKGTQAQVQSLESGFRAWIRNLHLAGDSHLPHCFPPRAASPRSPTSRSTPPTAPRGSCTYLLQARDDPSLLVPADEVWQTAATAR